jgi:hypothetical protein
LVPSADAALVDAGIVCHVRFGPAGQRESRPVPPQRGHASDPSAAWRTTPLEILVPAGTRVVELWFERHGSTGATDWDSRYGQNYTFNVVDEGLPVPPQSVVARISTLVDERRIRVLDDRVTKSAAGLRGNSTCVRTRLTVRALADGPRGAADTWADIHVFDATDILIHTGTIILQPAKAAADPALRVWDDEIYLGSGGGSGVGAWLCPDAHMVQYRLYWRVRARVFTDGVLHQLEVPADEDAAH